MPTSATGRSAARLRRRLHRPGLPTGSPSALRHRSAHRAFTLVELLVVLAIIAVLAGSIIPRMDRSITRHSLAEAAARFAHTCRTARQAAVAAGLTYMVQIDLDRSAYSVMRQNPSANDTTWTTPKHAWLKPQHWPADVRVASCRQGSGDEPTAGCVSLRFFPDGHSDGLALRITADQAAYEVYVHRRSGRVLYGRPDQIVIGPDEYDLGDG